MTWCVRREGGEQTRKRKKKRGGGFVVRENRTFTFISRVFSPGDKERRKMIVVLQKIMKKTFSSPSLLFCLSRAIIVDWLMKFESRFRTIFRNLFWSLDPV